jgi:Flp pilus assembly protein TadG
MSLERPHSVRRRDQRGYVATVVALLMPVVFIALSAVAVDTSRWYVEMQRVQNAADAAALAGVPYMPLDLPNATSTAKSVSARNGYTDGSNGATVTVAQGSKPSQLKVTVTSTINNVFGRLIGTPTTTVSRSATADYTGPAPMGSPCNTFGNEPSSGGGTSSQAPTGTVLPATLTSCTSHPEFWATVEGPDTDKGYGDRYGTIGCSSKSAVDYCLTSPKNDEYNQQGYYWVVKVQDGAVNHPVTVQLYDPAFVHTGLSCASLPAATALANDMNPYTKLDGKARYGKENTASSTGASFCTGDSTIAKSSAITTSFEMREQTDTQDPMNGAPISGCIKQYSGRTTAPAANELKYSSTWPAAGGPSATYDDDLAKVFHNWTSLCTFTPTRAGDYYLHVRTNVSAGGTASNNTANKLKIYTGNSAVSAKTGNLTTGEGVNSFGVRLVSDVSNLVSVSGYDRMPIFDNAVGKTSTLHLIRVLPGGAGQYISFSFFDAADTQAQNASASGTVTVIPPTDATGSIKTTPFPGGCKAIGGAAGGTSQTLTGCAAPISHSANNGRVETMSIPIPPDYSCDATSNTNCWYKVAISLPNIAASDSISDITTWDAQIVGDPVRLIK